MSLNISAEGSFSSSSSNEEAPVKGVSKLKVSTMHSLKAGGVVTTGTLDQYGNGSKQGKNTTFSDQSASKATGIKDI